MNATVDLYNYLVAGEAKRKRENWRAFRGSGQSVEEHPVCSNETG